MDIDTNEQLIAFCQEALRIPSYSGQEQGVAELMKRKMEEYGFDEVIIDRFGSVLGTINGKRSGKTVLMDGRSGSMTRSAARSRTGKFTAAARPT